MVKRRYLIGLGLCFAACETPASLATSDGMDPGADLQVELADLAIQSAPDLVSPDLVSNDDVDLARPRLSSGTYKFMLDAGAFPPTTEHPSVLVYVPSQFDPTPPINVVVYIHGWNNCVENIVRDAGQACTPGGTVRGATALAAQMETAGKNAILVCPEVRFDQPSGDPGNLGSTNGFRAFLAETLKDMESILGPLTLADVGKVVVSSHSGGYVAAAKIAIDGGVPVGEVHLLDSFYGNAADFDAWVKRDLTGLAGTPPPRRFATVYIGGATQTQSQQMATRAKTWVAGDAGIIVDDRTTSTWPDETYRHGLLFKLSGLSHSDVPRYYFGKLVTTSDLPSR